MDKRLRTEEFVHSVNKRAKGESLSPALRTARDGKQAAPLSSVVVQNNDQADRARLSRKPDSVGVTVQDGHTSKADILCGDQGH